MATITATLNKSKKGTYTADLLITNNTTKTYTNWTISCDISSGITIDKIKNFTVSGNILTPNSKITTLTPSLSFSVKFQGQGNNIPINWVFHDNSGPSPTPSPIPTPSPTPIPTPSPETSNIIIAPYCMPGSITIRNALSFSKTINSRQIQYITLAFWNNGNWDSGVPDSTLLDDIRKNGSDIIVSFGGYDGCKKKKEPSIISSTPEIAYQLYQVPITKYNVKYIDLDIEMGLELDIKSYQIRNSALVLLQKNNPGLKISFTVPADQTGIACQLMLQDAVNKGVVIDSIRLMLMDFGAKLDLVSATISGLQNAYKQLSVVGISNIPLGLIPLLMNDDDGINIYTIDNHNQILSQIKSLNMTYVTTFSYWELAIDQQQKFAFLSSYLTY